MKSVAVLGLGQFGYQLAIGLRQKGFNVLAIDKEESIVSEIKNLVSKALILDTTDEETMRSISIDNLDLSVVAIGSNVQSSLLTTALLQRIGVSSIHVRVINILQERILKSMGIHDIISIEREMGIQVANKISSDSVGCYVSLSSRHSLMEIKAPRGYIGKRLKDLNVLTKYKITVVGIKAYSPVVMDNGGIDHVLEMSDIVDYNHILNKDDALIISGSDDNLNKFIKRGAKHD